ncbi:hypothetical protein HDU76_004006 [Blyttiomyces sp. JEL0837]|nr:hypothetical protein HDU76_004006 [Blyttiomyces sp. JEL0837]
MTNRRRHINKKNNKNSIRDEEENVDNIPQEMSSTIPIISQPATTGLLKRFMIVGLGNTGMPRTRHNVGFMAVDHLLNELTDPKDRSSDFKFNSKIHAYLSEIIVTSSMARRLGVSNWGPFGSDGNENATASLVLVKPKGFMNFSGGPVFKASRELSIPTSQIIIIHDELERKLGSVTRKQGGSTGGHNGLRSIQASLHTPDYTRLRIGIDRPTSKDPDIVASYVLSKFSEQEIDRLESEAFPKAALEVLEWVKDVGCVGGGSGEKGDASESEGGEEVVVKGRPRGGKKMKGTGKLPGDA